ncbi:MAG: GDP-mannose 4,6-dehydratase [Capsulimonadaceae bacterium]|nr:GDP-mannose 4,6-dehydratase [Capsulimonadaceae bacterium]
MKASPSCRAIVVGSHGQDGRFLTDALKASGCLVAALSRSALDLYGAQSAAPIDILDRDSVYRLMCDFRPCELYYLAAHHGSSEASAALDPPELMRKSYETHVLGYENFLLAAKEHCPSTRIFYAASSHVFGWPTVRPQNEQTPFDPQCVYGITKATGVFLGRYYRREFGIHASAGILYNHESVYRRPGFVSRRIAETVANIARGSEDVLTVGNLDAVVDWGYAPDYVDAMRAIVALESADDYVVATGEAHTIGEFVAQAFEEAGVVDWRNRVVVDPHLITAKPRNLLGDAAKLKAATGWTPRVSFSEMVGILVRHYLTSDRR